MDKTKDEYVKIAIEIAIKVGILGIVLFVSFLILKPFLGILLWAIILAVALFPYAEKLSKKLNTSRKKVVFGFVILFSLSLVTPIYIFSDKAIDSTKKLTKIVKKGEFNIQAPPQKVKEWPLIGEKAYTLWDGASKNLKQTLLPFKDNIKAMANNLLSIMGNVLVVITISIISLIIAAFLIIDTEKYTKIYTDIVKRLVGDKGEEWAKLSVLTIRSVAVGIVGVGLLQALAAIPALIIMDVPFSIFIAIAIMFLTIIQLPALIIIAPVIAYVFSYADNTSATIFAVYMVIVGGSDGVLKPLLMGRGVDIPMLVVIVGAIGGMLLMGMIGLFIGAVIFSLAYKLFKLWMQEGEHN